MLTFQQHSKLNEKLKDSLGIKRKDMPQIFSHNMEDFKKFLYDNNISFFENVIHPEHLKPSQSELNHDKIEHLINNPKQISILTSHDKYVVDGHHRWASDLLADRPCNCFEISVPIKELLDKLHTYENVKYKAIGEQKK